MSSSLSSQTERVVKNHDSKRLKGGEVRFSVADVRSADPLIRTKTTEEGEAPSKRLHFRTFSTHILVNFVKINRSLIRTILFDCLAL